MKAERKGPKAFTGDRQGPMAENQTINTKAKSYCKSIKEGAHQRRKPKTEQIFGKEASSSLTHPWKFSGKPDVIKKSGKKVHLNPNAL